MKILLQKVLNLEFNENAIIRTLSVKVPILEGICQKWHNGGSYDTKNYDGSDDRTGSYGTGNYVTTKSSVVIFFFFKILSYFYKFFKNYFYSLPELISKVITGFELSQSKNENMLNK